MISLLSKIIIKASLCAQLVQVQVQVTSTQSYCGGAYPPDDLIERLHTPIPYNQTVYLYSADLKSPGIEISHASKVAVAPGKYILSFNANLSENTAGDKKFVRINERFNQDLAVELKATTKDTVLHFNFHHYCDWEINGGPPPP